jgi:membrane protein DedA with SNARE-associated domain
MGIWPLLRLPLGGRLDPARLLLATQIAGLWCVDKDERRVAPDLLVLFISAFAASTILPMSSEVVLDALAVTGTTDIWVLFVVATVGNTLGAVANWPSAAMRRLGGVA